MIHYKGQLKRVIWLSDKKKTHNPDNVQSKHKFK